MDTPSGSVDPEAAAHITGRAPPCFLAVAEIVGKFISFRYVRRGHLTTGAGWFGEFWAMGLGMMVASFGMFWFDMALIQLGGAQPARTANYSTRRLRCARSSLPGSESWAVYFSSRAARLHRCLAAFPAR